jgi:hypothetical protein
MTYGRKKVRMAVKWDNHMTMTISANHNMKFYGYFLGSRCIIGSPSLFFIQCQVFEYDLMGKTRIT